MTTLVHIFTQYYENYGSVEAPHWKPKGGQMFSVNVDSDALMYCEDDVIINTMKHAVSQHDSFLFKYEYVSHELVFSDIISLNDEEFANQLYDENCKFHNVKP